LTHKTTRYQHKLKNKLLKKKELKSELSEERLILASNEEVEDMIFSNVTSIDDAILIDDATSTDNATLTDDTTSIDDLTSNTEFNDNSNLPRKTHCKYLQQIQKLENANALSKTNKKKLELQLEATTISGLYQQSSDIFENQESNKFPLNNYPV
ncbi:13511_t:CDS:2, partial [Racocetra fulgida]